MPPSRYLDRTNMTHKNAHRCLERQSNAKFAPAGNSLEVGDTRRPRLPYPPHVLCELFAGDPLASVAGWGRVLIGIVEWVLEQLNVG